MVQEQFRPRPTKFKVKLQKHGIPVSHLAAHLGYSYPHFLNVLNGISPLSDSTEEKLQNFFDDLERKNGNRSRTPGVTRKEKVHRDLEDSE